MTESKKAARRGPHYEVHATFEAAPEGHIIGPQYVATVEGRDARDDTANAEGPEQLVVATFAQYRGPNDTAFGQTQPPVYMRPGCLVSRLPLMDLGVGEPGELGRLGRLAAEKLESPEKLSRGDLKHAMAQLYTAAGLFGPIVSTGVVKAVEAKLLDISHQDCRFPGQLHNAMSINPLFATRMPSVAFGRLSLGNDSAATEVVSHLNEEFRAGRLRGRGRPADAAADEVAMAVALEQMAVQIGLPTRGFARALARNEAFMKGQGKGGKDEAHAAQRVGQAKRLMVGGDLGVLPEKYGFFLIAHLPMMFWFDHEVRLLEAGQNPVEVFRDWIASPAWTTRQKLLGKVQALQGLEARPAAAAPGTGPRSGVARVVLRDDALEQPSARHGEPGGE